jgi:hypothetical protein
VAPFVDPAAHHEPQETGDQQKDPRSYRLWIHILWKHGILLVSLSFYFSGHGRRHRAFMDRPALCPVIAERKSPSIRPVRNAWRE